MPKYTDYRIDTIPNTSPNALTTPMGGDYYTDKTDKTEYRRRRRKTHTRTHKRRDGGRRRHKRTEKRNRRR